MNTEIVLLKDYIYIDPAYAEIYEYRLFLGKQKPNYIYNYEHIKWDGDRISLKQAIWQGFKLRPWLKEDQRNITYSEVLACRLWNITHMEETEPAFDNLPTKFVVIIEDETFRATAEMLIKAVIWLKNNLAFLNEEK